jgi:hypothetical protein
MKMFRSSIGLCQDQQGIAMMMTLVTMLILSILAAELVYQNQVYTSIVFRQRDDLRAKLLVKSALRLALRIKRKRRLNLWASAMKA